MTLTTREKIMASDATEREEKTVTGAATMEKLRREERERGRYGELRERERGDVMLRRLSEMGI